MEFSKKKKDLHLESVSNFSIFMKKLWSSLKKKGLLLESVSNFFIFVKKSLNSLKKNKKKDKGLHLESVTVFQLQCTKNSKQYGKPIMH